MMAGGAELEALSHELQGLAKEDPSAAAVARELAAELPDRPDGATERAAAGPAGSQPPSA